MIDKYVTLNLKNKNYDFLFDFLALRKVQNEYGSVQKWLKKLTGEYDSENDEFRNEVNIAMLIEATKLLINESIDIKNRENQTKELHIDDYDVNEILIEVGIQKALETITIAVNRAMQVEKKNN